MKRRVMIAKALSHEPRILFLDEPTAGVDVELRKNMWEIVSNLQKSGVTIILTTHYIEEAEEMADRIGIINNGEIILVEEKKKLLKQLGQKQLDIDLREAITALPEGLSEYDLTLSNEGKTLSFTYNANKQDNNIAALLEQLKTNNISYQDLHTRESSLEDIFVQLIKKS